MEYKEQNPPKYFNPPSRTKRDVGTPEHSRGLLSASPGLGRSQSVSVGSEEGDTSRLLTARAQDVKPGTHKPGTHKPSCCCRSFSLLNNKNSSTTKNRALRKVQSEEDFKGPAVHPLTSSIQSSFISTKWHTGLILLPLQHPSP